jgi:hypothetical protein
MYFVNKPTGEHAKELMHEYMAQIELNKNNKISSKYDKQQAELNEMKENRRVITELEEIENTKKNAKIQ